MGYWPGEEFQGNGIMTEVAKTLIDYAFHELNPNKVEIELLLVIRKLEVSQKD